MIPAPSQTKVWLAAGVADMSEDSNGLSILAENLLARSSSGGSGRVGLAIRA